MSSPGVELGTSTAPVRPSPNWAIAAIHQVRLAAARRTKPLRHAAHLHLAVCSVSGQLDQTTAQVCHACPLRRSRKSLPSGNRVAAIKSKITLRTPSRSVRRICLPWGSVAGLVKRQLRTSNGNPLGRLLARMGFWRPRAHQQPPVGARAHDLWLIRPSL